MDVSEFDMGAEETASQDVLARLHAALEEATAMEEVVEQLEQDLKAAKATLHKMRTGIVPDIMTEIQMDKTTWNGWDVSVSDFVSGSLPREPDKKARAIEWLEGNEGGSLIKTKLNVDFGKGEKEKADKLAALLVTKGLEPKVEVGAHAQSLQAFARERIKNGEPIDTEVLGLYTGRVAKFKKKPQK